MVETNVSAKSSMIVIYRIWSNEHEGWWKPEGNGYTPIFSEAGFFTKDEADKICIDANKYLKSDHIDYIPNEMMVPVDPELEPKQ